MTRVDSRQACEAVKQDLPANFAFLLREMRTSRDPRFAATLRLARENGWTPRTLALEVGMTVGAVARRLQRASGQLAPGVEVPVAPRHSYVEYVRPPLEPAQISHLRALRRRASHVRGPTPAADPGRTASRELDAELYALNQRGYGIKYLADVLGVWTRAVRDRLNRERARHADQHRRDTT
jgi:hypothetical protein